MIRWMLETRDIDSLIPHPSNPRKLSKHDADHLQKSLETFGLIDKPIINPNGQIIGGHQRWAILKRMKAKSVECWVPDKELSEKEINELNIRLNRNTGEWDFDLLANNWNLNDLLSWGFTEEELSIDLDSIEDASSEKEKEKKVCPHCGKDLD